MRQAQYRKERNLTISNQKSTQQLCSLQIHFQPYSGSSFSRGSFFFFHGSFFFFCGSYFSFCDFSFSYGSSFSPVVLFPSFLIPPLFIVISRLFLVLFSLLISHTLVAFFFNTPYSSNPLSSCHLFSLTVVENNFAPVRRQSPTK